MIVCVLLLLVFVSISVRLSLTCYVMHVCPCLSRLSREVLELASLRVRARASVFPDIPDPGRPHRPRPT